MNERPDDLPPGDDTTAPPAVEEDPSARDADVRDDEASPGATIDDPTPAEPNEPG